LVAYNHLEFRIREMLSFLINERDFQRADATIRCFRQSRSMLDLLEELFALTGADSAAIAELKVIRTEIKRNTETRNRFAHCRLLKPTDKREGVLRIRADDMSNAIQTVTLDQLVKAVEAIEACDRRLSAFCTANLQSYGKARTEAFMDKVLSGSISL
jgi:hypothetical protein